MRKIKKERNDIIWDKEPFNTLDEREPMKKANDDAEMDKKFLEKPAYKIVEQITNSFIRIDREATTPHYAFLDNIIQQPQLNCYFDAVIEGDIDFVKLY
jgi:ankyrin repeat protein